MNIKSLACALLSLAATTISFAQTVPAAPTETIKLDTSLVFARGSYGLPTDTDVTIALVNPTYKSGDWRVQASIPFVHISGPATVVGSTGGALVNHSASGLGDASLAVYRKLDYDVSGWTSTVGAKVKFPTADQNKGLGTGQTDESVEVNLLHPSRAATPFVTLGYQHLGSSEAYPMESGFYATAGFASPIVAGTTGGLAANWRQRTVRGGKEGVELMAFAQHDLDTANHVQAFVMHGFTDASPSLTIGLTYGHTF